MSKNLLINCVEHGIWLIRVKFILTFHSCAFLAHISQSILQLFMSLPFSGSCFDVARHGIEGLFYLVQNFGFVTIVECFRKVNDSNEYCHGLLLVIMSLSTYFNYEDISFLDKLKLE